MITKSEWSIEPQEDGVELRYKRRLLHLVPDVETARRLIRRHMQPGDRVLMVEDDGYRMDVTRDIQRER